MGVALLEGTASAEMDQCLRPLNYEKLKMSEVFQSLALMVREFPYRFLNMSLSQEEVEDLVRKVTALYNRVKSPEVTAKLIFVSPALITIAFSGGFCYGCGILDIVEGFANQFKTFTSQVEIKIGKTRQICPRVFQADYSIKIK